LCVGAVDNILVSSTIGRNKMLVPGEVISAIINGTAPSSIIYHFDFYRIKRLEEAYDIGFDDYIDSGNLCFIEWPELIEELLPEDAIRVEIEETDNGSRIVRF
ncbi:MAG: tRNA (adenosine(37)-N6)-threonylcarbamoyltransferase complex ATPase subunit type 1 TsaE, partial [Prevotella sp.]|nr:tRNA (adenosine(37)-N6)-threonylcarbamoyltransferase complex ATPase subunit type 1 TsaE [Prevotella sp.]